MPVASDNLSILIIEDNPIDLLLIETYLIENTKNANIIRAKNFQQSKDFFTLNTPFDVILLDLSLPDASGEQLINDIVKLARNTPVIAITGCPDKDFSVKILSLGVSDYLLKDELNASLLHKSIIYNIERKRIANTLEESEKKYRSLFQLSPIPMWVIDRETLNILNANYSAEQNYGYTIEEFTSMKFSEIKAIDKLTELERLIFKNKTENNLSNEITKHIKKNGDIIHVELQSNSIGFNQKNAWLVLAIDITEKIKAQEALIVSDYYFKALVKDGAELITIIDIDGNYKYVSPSSKSIFGVEANLLIGKNVYDFIHEDDKERVIKQFHSLSENKQIQVPPYRFKTYNNKWIWLETNASNMLDDPAINGIFSNSRDITIKVNYNLKLKETIERYEALAKATSFAVWDHDFKIGRTYVAGEGFKNLFGYNLSNQLCENQFLESKIHPEDILSFNANLKAVLNDPNIDQSEREYRFLKADGTYAYVSDKFFIIRENGKAMRMLGAKQDITLRKKEEHHLKLLESVITNSSDAVMITEADIINGHGPIITFVNEAFVKMTGYLKEELIGNTPQILQGPETSRVELNKIRTAIEKHITCETEIINYNKKGQEYWVELSIAPVTNHLGKISHFIVIEKDITNRKNLEQERERLITELTQNNKDLRQFSYITSHNLRGPIANLLGLSSLIDVHKIEDETLKEILNGIKKAALMFDDTLKDLTNVLNIKDQPAVPQEKIVIETTLAKAILQNKILFETIEIDLNSNFSQAPTVTFNKAYFESIIFNLLSNSIKYRSPKRSLKINATTENTTDAIVLKFTDNGLGIDINLYKERLFRLYQRFHDHAEGKGLGLFLIKSQLEALGGSIDIESELGIGTTFILKFKK